MTYTKKRLVQVRSDMPDEAFLCITPVMIADWCSGCAAFGMVKRLHEAKEGRDGGCGGVWGWG